MMEKSLTFKWTVSRGRDTYGYNICSLWIDGQIKVSSCNGGGYDMKGTALGNWIARAFSKELLALKEEYYGLSFHDPNYNPGTKIIDGQTVEERELAGKSIGLERYQAFHGASSKTPTENHIIPLIDGGCGFESMVQIIEALGHKLRYIDGDSNRSTYLLEEIGVLQDSK